MPRTHAPGASTLRNRNRITNKTRLRIIRGNVEAEDLLIPDEDEEKHRLTNLVAGVDAEDANEHHLQEVLSAAQHKGTKKTEEKPTAYIPTPDSNGAADNWEALYPNNVWKDPATFVCTSTSVEESLRDGLANGFSYFMDERDKEWLDKNNEEARGEGTSAQGALSASGTRTSARSAKAKGKEPDVNLPVVISEDEFELVMGLFEKVTHEKTEYLHHSLETGMPFPGFSEYQEMFASTLPPSTFATHTVPTWIPPPQHLLRIARTIYSYWKERRIERAGHRIIPTLNFDESDTPNESYICFRRREIKAVRKTRQAQVTSSDKLVRLQGEFAYPLELARQVLQRETVKKEQAIQSQQVWERRMALADLKRKFPLLSDKTDEELLIDKERPTKRPDVPRLPGVKIPPNATSLQPLRPDPVIKPRERIAQVKEKTDAYLARRKEEDKIWEDVIDNPQQNAYTPYASRLFKFIPPPSAPMWPADASDKTSESDDERNSASRAIRLRYGRGGRLLLDRREFGPERPIVKRPRSSLFGGDEDMVTEDDLEAEERRRRLEERWRFDLDDGPPPPSADEDSRILVDDYDPKYLRYAMTLLQDKDHYDLSTDPSLCLPTQDGRQQTIVPYRLGMPPIVRNQQQQMRAHPGVPPPNQATPAQGGLPLGTPVAMQHHMKKMPPPTAIPQMRISSNGGMRPPGLPASGLPQNEAGGQTSPPQSLSIPATHTPINGVNGGSRAAIAMPHVEMVKTGEPIISNGSPTAAMSTDASTPSNQDASANSTPAPVKPQTQQMPMTLPNGYHVTPVNPAAAAAFVAGNYQLQNGQSIAMNLQKMQELKTVFANMPPQQLVALQAQSNRAFAQNFIHANGNNPSLQMPLHAGNMKLPPGAVRQLQWSLGAGMQRPSSGMNGGGGDGSGVGNAASPSASAASANLIPVRSPSTNGTRPAMRVPTSGHQMSPHLQHVGVNGGGGSPMPNIAATSQSQSPPRHGIVPTIGLVTPPIQHQQPVGSTQNGY